MCGWPPMRKKVSHSLWLHVRILMWNTSTHSRVYSTRMGCTRVLRMRKSLWRAKLIRHWSLWWMLHLVPSHSWLLSVRELLRHEVVLSASWPGWLVWHLLILYELLLLELHVLLLGLWLVVWHLLTLRSVLHAHVWDRVLVIVLLVVLHDFGISI